jgi:hypothetical protein
VAESVETKRTKAKERALLVKQFQLKQELERIDFRLDVLAPALEEIDRKGTDQYDIDSTLYEIEEGVSGGDPDEDPQD